MARHAGLLLPLGLFLWGALTGLDAHGLYMDAVNPDYLVARLLGPARHEIVPWVLQGNLLQGRYPLLIQLYHGALPFWLGLPGYLVLGTDVPAIRMVHAGFGMLVLAGLYAFLMAFGVRRLAALAALCVLALDPSLLLAFRTQFYITLLPLAFVLFGAALTRAGRWRWSMLAAGLCAGLAVHGYFIHGAFFLVLLAQAAWRGPARGFCQWLLGAALGGSVYPLGLAALLASARLWPPALAVALAWLCVLATLGWLATRERPLRPLLLATLLGTLAAILLWLILPPAEVAAALAPLSRNLAGLEPGRSNIPLDARIALLGQLGILALNGTAGAAILLGDAVPGNHAMLRGGLLMGMLGLALPFLLRKRDAEGAALRRGMLLTLALLAAHLPLGLAFGDRLWVHHMVAVPVLMAAWLGFALQALPARPRLAAIALLALPLGLLGAMDRDALLTALERTGGAGLSSDAITRFSRDVALEAPRAVVHAPDWGVLMPFIMVTGGRVAIQDSASVPDMRSQMCGGRPVILALLGTQAEARIAGFTETLGPATTRLYAQRDGTPLLWSAQWPARACPGG